MWIWVWQRTGVQRVKPLEVFNQLYTVFRAILWIFGMPTDSFLLREIFSFCHEFTLTLKSKWKDLNSRHGGCRIYLSKIYFSIFLKNKEEEKTEVTLSLILRFNLRLGGYSIYSASTSRTIYDQDFGAWAPHNLKANGSTWRTTRRIWRKNQK